MFKPIFGQKNIFEKNNPPPPPHGVKWSLPNSLEQFCLWFHSWVKQKLYEDYKAESWHTDRFLGHLKPMFIALML